MKVCIFGSGAIGSHLAARLYTGGSDVSVVARGTHLEAILANGLMVQAPQETMHFRPRASSESHTLGVQDAVIVTVKAPALPAAIESLSHLIGPQTVVAFISNGIPWWYFQATQAGSTEAGSTHAPARHLLDPERHIGRIVDPARMLGGVVYSACTVSAPGTVHVTSASSRIILGQPQGLPSADGEHLVQALRAGGVGATLAPDIRADVWAKWVANMGTGIIASLTGAEPRAFLRDPACETLVRAIVAEACRLSAAMGYPVNFPIEEQMGKWRQAHHLPSIAQDLGLGRPIELDALYGAPLLMREELGVELPLLQTLIPLLKARAKQLGCN